MTERDTLGRGGAAFYAREFAWRSSSSSAVLRSPGLFFVGLKFLYSPSSETLIGVGRDAARIAAAVAARSVHAF
jgi:hypothetical protein